MKALTIRDQLALVAEKAKDAERRCDNPAAIHWWNVYERLELLAKSPQERMDAFVASHRGS